MPVVTNPVGVGLLMSSIVPSMPLLPREFFQEHKRDPECEGLFQMSKEETPVRSPNYIEIGGILDTDAVKGVRVDNVSYADRGKFSVFMSSDKGEGVIARPFGRRPDAALIRSAAGFFIPHFDLTHEISSLNLGVREWVMKQGMENFGVEVPVAYFDITDQPVDSFDLFMGFRSGRILTSWAVEGYHVFLDPNDHKSAPAEMVGCYDCGFVKVEPRPLDIPNVWGIRESKEESAA